MITKFMCRLLVGVLILGAPQLRAESVEDKFAQISPLTSRDLESSFMVRVTGKF